MNSLNDLWNYIVKKFFSQENKEQNNYNNIKEFCVRKIASLPIILNISINRAFTGKSLVSNKLQYEEEINLNNYIDEIIKEDNNTYKLYAVNECFGLTKHSGHYYFYVKVNNTWLKFDDRHVSEETPNFNSKYVVGLYYIKNNF